jgi:hypothetical protein
MGLEGGCCVGWCWDGRDERASGSASESGKGKAGEDLEARCDVPDPAYAGFVLVSGPFGLLRTYLFQVICTLHALLYHFVLHNVSTPL